MLAYRRRSLGGAVLAPVNLILPAITGLPNISQTLAVSSGTWRNNPTSITYQWTLDGSPITGETSTSYAVQAGDKTHVVGCEIVATNNAASVGPVNAGMQYDPASTVLASGPKILGALLMRDTFTAADGTAITAHTDEDGNTYAIAPGASGTLAINNKGRVYRTSTAAAHFLNSWTPPSADFDIEWDLFFLGAFNFTSWAPAVTFRASNSVDTTYGMRFAEFTGASTYRFFRRLTGTSAQIGTSYGPGTVAAGTVHHLLARVRGSRMDCYINDPAITFSRAGVTDANIAAAGQVGLWVDGGSTAETETSGIFIDNLRVSSS